MSFIYLFKGWQTKDFNSCYEWRKIVLRSSLWSMLPLELVEMIAKACTIIIPYDPRGYQPSGSINSSRIDSLKLSFTDYVLQHKQDEQKEDWEFFQRGLLEE